MRKMSELSGLRSLRFAVACSRECSELLCEHLPAALADAGIDLAIVDQNEPAGGTVAEHLGIPFVSICPSLPLNREPDIPPPFVSWGYRTTPWTRLRNRIGCRLADRLIAPINKTVNRYRSAWGLAPLRTPDDSFSNAAQLCQMTADFDFPRLRLPASFHYVGPFCDNAGPAIRFPFEQLNGKPLIYASLGTLQDRNSRYFRTIAEACTDLDAQLVISTGGSSAYSAANLPGSPVVVHYAPQAEILARASLTITHAGLNTVMQSLAFGVPMVALPITHDQPAIAARVKRSGAGVAIPAARATARSLRAAVQRVTTEPAYRTQAGKLRKSIEAAGGVERAATIVEDVLSRMERGPGRQRNALRNH
jgi:MGT family glycosyltransferase